MLTSISYFKIFGLPVIAYLGILTLVCLLFTASIAIMNKQGITKIPMKYHFFIAKITIILAIIHAFFAIMARF